MNEILNFFKDAIVFTSNLPLSAKGIDTDSILMQPDENKMLFEYNGDLYEAKIEKVSRHVNKDEK